MHCGKKRIHAFISLMLPDSTFINKHYVGIWSVHGHHTTKVINYSTFCPCTRLRSLIYWCIHLQCHYILSYWYWHCYSTMLRRLIHIMTGSRVTEQELHALKYKANDKYYSAPPDNQNSHNCCKQIFCYYRSTFIWMVMLSYSWILILNSLPELIGARLVLHQYAQL